MEKILLVSRLEVLTNFLEKGKVPVTIGETREEGTTVERGCLLLVTELLRRAVVCRRAARRTAQRNLQVRWKTEAAQRRQGKAEPGKMKQIQEDIPQKDLSPEPEPHQQSRWRLLKKGEKEHPPLCSEDRVDGQDHW